MKKFLKGAGKAVGAAKEAVKSVEDKAKQAIRREELHDHRKEGNQDLEALRKQHAAVVLSVNAASQRLADNQQLLLGAGKLKEVQEIVGQMEQQKARANELLTQATDTRSFISELPKNTQVSRKDLSKEAAELNLTIRDNMKLMAEVEAEVRVLNARLEGVFNRPVVAGGGAEAGVPAAVAAGGGAIALGDGAIVAVADAGDRKENEAPLADPKV